MQKHRQLQSNYRLASLVDTRLQSGRSHGLNPSQAANNTYQQSKCKNTAGSYCQTAIWFKGLIVSKETVVLDPWGSETQEFGFIN